MAQSREDLEKKLSQREKIALDADPYAALMHVRTPQPRSAVLGDSTTRGGTLPPRRPAQSLNISHNPHPGIEYP